MTENTSENNVPKVSAKKKKIIMLPELKDVIVVPNRVVNSRYDYTLIQERIFNNVLYYLQEAVRLNMKGGDYTQLSLFRTTNDNISIDIPLRSISRPDQYDEVRQSAQDLAGIVVKIPMMDARTGKHFISFQGLFSAIAIPVDSKRSSYITVRIAKEVASLLIQMDHKNGIPGNYTSFFLQVANRSSNKYTSKLYKLISSWKKKGGFYMPIDEFREHFNLTDKYQEFSELKKRVLVPVAKELKENADCWFEVADNTLVKREGKKVVGLNFKVITPEYDDLKSKQLESIYHLLRTHFKFTGEHLKQLDPIFKGDFNAANIQYKIVELYEYVRENKKNIGNQTAYVIKSLLKQFS